MGVGLWNATTRLAPGDFQGFFESTHLGMNVTGSKNLRRGDSAYSLWKAATGGKGVDLIVDQVSAGVANANMEAAAVLGRIINVGRLGGMKGDFDFDLHALKRISYIGVTFRTRSPDEYRAIVHAARADLWSAVEAGTLSLPVDRTFPLHEVTAALEHMKANAHFGKIVLTM
jgi:NADPH2:quinone reductase